jgi:hypothetical protein
MQAAAIRLHEDSRSEVEHLPTTSGIARAQVAPGLAHPGQIRIQPGVHGGGFIEEDMLVHVQAIAQPGSHGRLSIEVAFENRDFQCQAELSQHFAWTAVGWKEANRPTQDNKPQISQLLGYGQQSLTIVKLKRAGAFRKFRYDSVHYQITGVGRGQSASQYLGMTM